MLSKFNLKTMYLGVSKESCPVCVEILNAIASQLDLDVFVGGKHRKYFPCAFPSATPQVVLQQVINSLSWNLEKKLLKLAEDKPRRPSSLMSQSFSKDVDGVFDLPPPFNLPGMAMGIRDSGEKGTGKPYTVAMSRKVTLRVTVRPSGRSVCYLCVRKAMGNRQNFINYHDWG